MRARLLPAEQPVHHRLDNPDLAGPVRRTFSRTVSPRCCSAGGPDGRCRRRSCRTRREGHPTIGFQVALGCRRRHEFHSMLVLSAHDGSPRWWWHGEQTEPTTLRRRSRGDGRIRVMPVGQVSAVERDVVGIGQRVRTRRRGGSPGAEPGACIHCRSRHEPSPRRKRQNHYWARAAIERRHDAARSARLRCQRTGSRLVEGAPWDARCQVVQSATVHSVPTQPPLDGRRAACPITDHPKDARRTRCSWSSVVVLSGQAIGMRRRLQPIHVGPNSTSQPGASAAART